MIYIRIKNVIVFKMFKFEYINKKLNIKIQNILKIILIQNIYSK